jgi:hypothetical protein
VSPEKWATALWAHYRPRVVDGAPFYLAADRSLLHQLYRDVLGGMGGPEVAMREFQECCMSLFGRSHARPRVSVRVAAFHVLSGRDFSAVICLAVQQVLVVERMLNDAAFSENAYFPRYREALGLPDGGEHSVPMPTEEFQRIWSTLASELRQIDGASAATVTFCAGIGRDLNRHLPFSQALFTAHDLTIIKEYAPALDGRADRKRVLRSLREVRRELGTRASRLIRSASESEIVAERLCDQVLAFLASDGQVSELRQRAAGLGESGEMVAYLERGDLFDSDDEADTFAVYLRTPSEQVSGDRLESVLYERSKSPPFVLLASVSDSFQEMRPDQQLAPGDGVVALVRAAWAEPFVAQAKRICAATFVAARSNLSDSFRMLVCTSGAERTRGLLGVPDVFPAERGLELVGGLLADARSRDFVAGYPPTGLRFDGRALGAETIIVVAGGVERSLGGFLGGLGTPRGLVRHAIRYGSRSLEFSLGARSAAMDSSAPLGYGVREGELDLTPRRLKDREACLRGALFTAGERRASRLSPPDLLLLVSPGRRYAVSDAVLATLLDEIRCLAGDDVRAELATRQLTATRSVPLKAATSGLLRRLRRPREGRGGVAPVTGESSYR